MMLVCLTGFPPLLYSLQSDRRQNTNHHQSGRYRSYKPLFTTTMDDVSQLILLTIPGLFDSRNDNDSRCWGAIERKNMEESYSLYRFLRGF